MVRDKEDVNFTTPPKKLRFRGDYNSFNSRIEEVVDEQKHANHQNEKEQQQKNEACSSFFDFFKVEMTRGYMLEHDEERYTARRQKIYSFMRIPRDLERFIVYGIMQCADSFLYIHTFLPVRFALAFWSLITRPICNCFGWRRRALTPAEICDLLKSSIWIACIFLMLSVDTNRVYHIIKSQSIIKLYIFYNMLEVGDRLLSAFGQDTIDALFWTATEPKTSKRQHIGLLTHVILALIYVMMHSLLIMFQATALNVAVNSNNKALLTIMMSNNFVELKGSVFKKFDKNNLFQLTCSDVRERFHLSVLLFIVIIQTMKEFNWSLTHLCVLLPDCFAVLLTEILVDWIKHAFITRFNEISEGIYREYTTSLAYDMTQTRQKHAFSDHSDLVARRMGFIPFPLSVVLIKAVHSAVNFHNLAAFLLFLLAYAFLLGLRICLTIFALGKACKLMKEHQDEKNIATPLHNATSSAGNNSNSTNSTANSSYCTTPKTTHVKITPALSDENVFIANFIESNNLTVTTPTTNPVQKSASLAGDICSTSEKTQIENALEFGATALFSNSDVDLNDVHLNDKLLELPEATSISFVEMACSQPDLSTNHNLDTDTEMLGDLNNESLSDYESNSNHNNNNNNLISEVGRPIQQVIKRTHRRSESEPNIQNASIQNETS